jgi:tRNA nucleotidyltransferase/poly(A) polymerase
VLRRPELVALARELRRRKASGWIVGGAARDLILGREVPDVDVAVDADPFLVARALEAEGAGTCVPLSESEPRVARVAGRHEIDVAQLVGRGIEDDLARRDFTVNAIAIPLDDSNPNPDPNPTPSALIDPFGGAADLAAGRLRMISEANLRDDPLRAWRAARFIATHSLLPDARTTAACRRTAPLLGTAAPERLGTELEKLLAAPRCARALAWAAGAGLLGEALGIPLEPPRARAVARGPFDAPALVRRPPDDRVRLRLAILAARLGFDPEAASGWLLGRRFSRATARSVGSLLALARRASSPSDRDGRWAWVRDAGGEAGGATTLAKWIHPRSRAAVESHARAARAARVPPRVTGKDVLDWVGGPPGPEVGAWLRRLEIEGLRGAITTRAQARRWLREAAGPRRTTSVPTGKGAAGL